LWSDKQVVIGFPHTSNMDAVRAFALFMALGLKTYTLIKRELFCMAAVDDFTLSGWFAGGSRQ
jgi:hypothetical protein